MPDLDVVYPSPVATELLLMRNLMSFQEHSIIGKGEFYKKGHNVKSWRHRAWVINDFSNVRDEPSKRDGKLRYFKPQGATGYDRDTSKDVVSQTLGLNSDQKTVKLDSVWFYPGKRSNIQECETIFKSTAFALNVTIESRDEDVINKIADQKVDTWELETVFDTRYDAENFIRALYQSSKKCPNLIDFLNKEGLDERNVLRKPRLTFEPTYQTALGCCKIAPFCKMPDCIGWGSYCVCLCAEMYTQGGLMFNNEVSNFQTGHLAPQIYAQCCVIEAIVCECRMVRKCMCKLEQQVCCIDNRCALPTDDDVPCALSLLGLKCCGKDTEKIIGTELEPLKDGSQPKKTTLDKIRETIGGNTI